MAMFIHFQWWPLSFFIATFLLSSSAASQNVQSNTQQSLKLLKLSSSEETKLNSGEMIVRQADSSTGTGGSATAIQVIQAPADIVWKQLLDFNAYVGKVDKLTKV